MPRISESRSGNSFFDAASLQVIVIGALMMREIHTRYGRDNLGFLWLVMEPLMFSMGVIGLWTGLHGRYQHGVPILAFVITGYLPLTLWRHVTNRAVHCFRANSALLYHRQVRMMDLLAARIVLEFFGAVIAFVMIAFVFWAADMYEPPREWGLFYLGWMYFVLFVAGFGMIVGSLTEIYEWTEKMVGPLMYLMLPICGVFFMVDWLPEKWRHYALYVPTVSAFEMIRGGQFGSAVRVHYDLAYLSLCCAGMILLGFVLCRNVHRHLVIE